jgi:CBS domain containing-hemolysin-like protein
MIIITYPLSKPTQILLDKLFKKSSTVQLHSRRELGFIFNQHSLHESSELDEDEVEIIQNTLLLSEKRVSTIMTPINKTFWLNIDSNLTNELLIKMSQKNFSRIPVFNDELTHCYGILLMKELVQIDKSTLPIKISSCNLYQTKTIGSRTVLDTLFRKFISAKTHMMPVEKDDEIIGVVTIEDLIEEIIGHEIEDEADRKQHRTA